MTEPAPSGGPLDGVRVLDLAVERAGSVAAMLLADLGADVVRPQSPDGAHERRSPYEDVAGICWDRGKRRVIVDSTDPGTDASLDRLLLAADVVVIDGGPASVRAGGLRPDLLAQRNPHAVIGWLPTNGAEGASAELPADPLVLAAITGFAQWQTSTVDAPVAPVVPFLSNIHGVLGASTMLGALLERQRSGVGQVVTVTGLHAASLMLATVTGQSLDQPMAYSAPRDVRGSASFRLYRCSDGRSFFLGALVPTIFLTALDAIDMLEVMVLPGMDGEFMNLYVGDNGMRVALALEARFAAQPIAHWLEVFDAAGVPAAAVQTRDEWTASDAFASAAGLVERPHPVVGPVRLPATPFTLSATPMRVGALADNRVVDVSTVWPHTEVAPPDAPGAVDTGPPLAGLRVLDLSTFLAGPTGPTLLAQWGAEVIKVEPLSGDPYRLYNVSYVAANQGKRRVVLDLTTDAGMAALFSLVAGADVLVDNFRPSLRNKLGLGTAVLHAINPQLVHTTINAFGDQGPFAESPGFDPVIQACSGLMHACGDDDQAHYTSTPVHDVATGSLAALGTLAALYARARIGCGQHVSMSLAASSLLVQCEELTTYQGRPGTARGGTPHLGDAPTRRYYRARDGWVAVVATRAQSDALVAWSGADPRAAEAAESIAVAASSRDVAQVVGELASLGIAAVRVVERDGLVTDPHLAAHQLVHEVVDPEIGRCLVVNQVARWSRSTPVDTTSAPPRISEAVRWRSAHEVNVD
jgi:crotonobetainyl-CoA:carnitine CoA-transferase CaiB-like acyl-CoA transferase